jgi:hypothetical protein
MWENLPIVIHCTDFKDEKHLTEILHKNLFKGLSGEDRIQLAIGIYTDTSRFLACTNGTGGSGKDGCKFCRKVITVQRQVAREILRSASREKQI